MTDLIDWFLDRPGILLFSVLVILLGLLWFIDSNEEKESKRLMAQCMADGKKEYECVAMLRSKSSVTVVPAPVYIPAR